MRDARLGLVTALSGALVVAGCDKIPGTDAYKIKIAQEVAARDLIDPSSAQFRDLKVQKDVVCGEINAKNRMGAYVGFKRFFADSKAKTASIDPAFDLNDLLSAQDLCRSARSNSYSSYSLIKSACDREMEQTLAQLSQTVFDSGWKLYCEGKKSRDAEEAAGAEVLSNDVAADANMTMDELAPLSNDMNDADGQGILVDENGEPVTDTDASARNERTNNRAPEPEDPLQPKNDSAQSSSDE